MESMDSAPSIWGAGAATVLVSHSGAAIAGSTPWRRGPLRSLRWPTPNLSSLAPSPALVPALPCLHIGLDHISGGGEGVGPGEFVLVKRHQVQRLATFRPIPILSQAQRSYHPWQITYAYLTSAFDWDDLQTAYGGTDLLQFLSARTQQMNRLLTETVKAPWSSSCSYLCDAVAAAIGIYRQQAAYSGQGGLALRKLLTAKALSSASPYPLKIRSLYQKEQPIPYLEPRPMWEQLLEDLQTGLPAAAIAGRFYLGLIEGIAEMVRLLAETHPIGHVALSGRLLQHPMLTYRLKRSLAETSTQLTQVA